MLDRYDFGPKPVIIGQGSSAVVYKVTDTRAQRIIALKVFTREDALDDGELASISSAARVQAQNIVSPVDHGRISVPGDTRQLPFIAFEYHDGRSLAGDGLARVSWSDVAPEDGRTWCADALQVVQQSFAGLQQIHQAGLKHLAIKPSNILVVRDANRRVTAAKLLDAGLASVGRHADQRARALYRAPEQFAGDDVTEAADVFSLGVVAYELLTRRHPFADASGRVEGEALARNFASMIPVSISELNQYVPEAVALVIHQTLAREAADRPSSAEVMRLLDCASVQAEQWLSISAEFAKAREFHQQGDLEKAASTLTALERKGWAFPPIIELRTRVSAELELRASMLERQAEDIAAAEEAMHNGRPRQALWHLELLRVRQENDPYGQDKYHGEVARLRSELERGRDNEKSWLNRMAELIRNGRIEEATAKCAQIGKSVRPTRAVLAMELECRAHKYRSVISSTLKVLDSHAQDERAALAASAMTEVYATPNALTECFQLLEARSGLIDELKFEAATHHDAGDVIAELDVIEALLKIAPDKKLQEDQRALEATMQRQLADQCLAIMLDTMQRLVEIGDWERARNLIQSAGTELEDDSQLAALAPWSQLEQRAPEPRLRSTTPAPPAPMQAAHETHSAPALVDRPAPALVDRPAAQQPAVCPLPEARPAPMNEAARPAPAPQRTAARAATTSLHPRTILGVGAAGVVIALLAAVAIPKSKAANEQAIAPPPDPQPSAPPPIVAAPVDTPAAPQPTYGSITIVTPNQNDVEVLVDRKSVGRTSGQRFTIDSLSPGAHTIAVKTIAGFCLSGSSSRRVTVRADQERSDTFTLKPWPRLTVNSEVSNADFTVTGDDAGPYRVGHELPLEPGKHRYTVKAAAHHDSTADVTLKCGENRTVSISPRKIVVARDTTPREPVATKPKPTDAGWSENCFKNEIGWQKAARDCFFDDGDAIRRFRFEVRRVKKGGVGPVGGSDVYGSWLVGKSGNFVECKIEDGEFRWRLAGKGDWQKQKIDVPKDAPSLFVRVSSDSDGAALEISPDAGMTGAQRVRVSTGGGFGVKKDVQLREFRRG